MPELVARSLGAWQTDEARLRAFGETTAVRVITPAGGSRAGEPSYLKICSVT